MSAMCPSSATGPGRQRPLGHLDADGHLRACARVEVAQLERQEAGRVGLDVEEEDAGRLDAGGERGAQRVALAEPVELLQPARGAGGGEQLVGTLERAAAGPAGQRLPADDAPGRQFDDGLEARFDGTLSEDVGELGPHRARECARRGRWSCSGDEHLGSDRREHGGPTFAAEPSVPCMEVFLPAAQKPRRNWRRNAPTGQKAPETAGSGDVPRRPSAVVPDDRAGDFFLCVKIKPATTASSARS